MQIVGHQLIHSWYSAETEMLKLFKNEANYIILWLKSVVHTVHFYPMMLTLNLEKETHDFQTWSKRNGKQLNCKVHRLDLRGLAFKNARR